MSRSCLCCAITCGVPPVAPGARRPSRSPCASTSLACARDADAPVLSLSLACDRFSLRRFSLSHSHAVGSVILSRSQACGLFVICVRFIRVCVCSAPSRLILRFIRVLCNRQSSASRSLRFSFACALFYPCSRFILVCVAFHTRLRCVFSVFNQRSACGSRPRSLAIRERFRMATQHAFSGDSPLLSRSSQHSFSCFLFVSAFSSLECSFASLVGTRRNIVRFDFLCPVILAVSRVNIAFAFLFVK
ncbi:hypothetical protein P5V15_013799 [Pogonomyrmex californicus]